MIDKKWGQRKENGVLFSFSFWCSVSVLQEEKSSGDGVVRQNEYA